MKRNPPEQMEGYDFCQRTRIERSFIDCLPVSFSVLCKPIQEAKEKGELVRIVIDYDPHEQKTEFRYYHPQKSELEERQTTPAKEP